jgi:Winged helix DNA-binding domain
MKALGEVGRIRLVSQRITRTTFKAPAEVVAWLGAMQAQDYEGAKWSMGLRLAAGTEAQVEEAIAKRSIIRTWPMRGTLHFVAAPDVRWLLALVSARSIAHSAGRHRQLELDDATFTRSKHLFSAALEGGKQLSRAEMYSVLEKRGISTVGQRGIHMLWRAAQDGLICFGALRGKEQTFVLLEEWAPDAKPMDREQALAEIARRYFTSRGPATVHDFAWWMGVTLTDARAGLDLVKSQLVQETIGGQAYWMAPNLSMPRHASASVHLLPGFDEFVLGYRDRSAVLDPKYASRICPGGNGVFYPTIVVDGRIAGLWKRSVKKDHVAITAHPFTALSETESKAFAKAAKRYAKYLEMAAHL